MNFNLEHLIPLLGLLPVLLSMVLWIKQNKNKGQNTLLATLEKNKLITKPQLILYQHISFLKTQDIGIDVDGKIFFRTLYKLRIIFHSIAVLFGLFWAYITYLSVYHKIDFDDKLISIIVYIILLTPSLIFLKYASNKTILDLNNGMVTFKKSFAPKYDSDRIIILNLKNCDTEISTTQIKFTDNNHADKTIRINVDLSDSEVKIWNLIIEQITITNKED